MLAQTERSRRAEQLLVDAPGVAGVQARDLGAGPDEVGPRRPRRGLLDASGSRRRRPARRSPAAPARAGLPTTSSPPSAHAQRPTAARPRSTAAPRSPTRARCASRSRRCAGRSSSASIMRRPAKKAASGDAEDRHDERAVEVVVAHLAGGLGDQRAAVAGGAVEPAALHALARRVLGADRVVRAERRHPQRVGEVVLDVPRLLHQAAERPLGVGAAGVEQDPEALGVGVRVDPLADRARRVAAAHRERLDQEVRERVQQHVRPARERRARSCGPPPSARARSRGASSRCLTAGPLEPLLHGLGAKLDEDAFAAVLDRREPRRLERDLRALDVGLVLAVDVRRHGLEAGEADQRQDLAQPVELDDGLDPVAALASGARLRSAGGARGSSDRPARRRRSPRARRAGRRARPA